MEWQDVRMTDTDLIWILVQNSKQKKCKGNKGK